DVTAQVAAELVLRLADLLAQAVGGAVVEAADANVGEVAFRVVGHSLWDDVRARNRKRARLDALALDRQEHLGAAAATQAVYNILLGEPFDADPVDGDDDVVLTQPRGFGRGVFHDGEHQDTLLDEA